MRRDITPKIEGKLAKYATIREVKSVPVTMPTIPGIKHDNYLRTEPGLYPDLLLPSPYDGNVYLIKDQLKALWIEIDLRKCFEEITAGENELELICFYAGQVASSATVTVEIVDALLPKQELILTQWFYCDCIASYYHCDVWSERHWELVENFARVAHSNGINLLLTPVFTPALDTRVGGERLTNQLVGVTKNGDKYTGNFHYDRMWGEGVYEYANGDKYEGSFENNLKSGTGTYTFRNGDVYVGEFANDMRNGKGVYTYVDGSVYEGKYVDNIRNDDKASMTIKYSDGTFDVYIGSFINDSREGQGSYTWANGDNYVGNFTSNNMDGEGTYTWASGRTYTGKFSMGSIVKDPSVYPNV
jgi:hypothetical protein